MDSNNGGNSMYGTRASSVIVRHPVIEATEDRTVA